MSYRISLIQPSYPSTSSYLSLNPSYNPQHISYLPHTIIVSSSHPIVIPSSYRTIVVSTLIPHPYHTALLLSYPLSYPIVSTPCRLYLHLNPQHNPHTYRIYLLSPHCPPYDPHTYPNDPQSYHLNLNRIVSSSIISSTLIVTSSPYRIQPPSLNLNRIVPSVSYDHCIYPSYLYLPFTQPSCVSTSTTYTIINRIFLTNLIRYHLDNIYVT